MPFAYVAAPFIAMSILYFGQGAEQSVKSKGNGEFIASQYPAKSLAAGEQGKVEFRLVVEPDGSLGTCEVTGSSGFKSLDDETCELILRYARLTPVRNADGRAVRAVQQGYINWVHPDKAVQLATAPSAAITLPDKITCKKSPTTGSLIRRTKQCMSNRQWAEHERITKDRIYRIVGQGYADKISSE